MSVDEVVNLYVEYLKLSVCLGTNKPVFEEDFRKYWRCNCYCYALGISFPKLIDDRYFDAKLEEFNHTLGFISKSVNLKDF